MPQPTDNQIHSAQSFTDGLRLEMAELETENRYRAMTVVTDSSETECLIDDQRYINFCSNHYLGRFENPQNNAEASGSGSSRLIVGTSPQAITLEKMLADSHNQEAALLFPSGYQANVATLTGLLHKDDLVLFDKHCHASLIDGIRWSGARWQRYAHLDMTDLEAKLQQAKTNREKKPYRQCWIITDTLFSMDGDVSDLKKLFALAECFDALVYLDEAHAVGVYGDGNTNLPNSFPAGLATECGLESHPNLMVTMGSLSKAFGSLGGYVAGSQVMINYLVNTSRGFIYSTALPPSMISDVMSHLGQIEASDNSKTKALWNRVGLLKEKLNKANLNTIEVNSPIVPVMIGGDKDAIQASDFLKKQGILVQPIRYPTVPKAESRLRISLQADHTDAQLQALVLGLVALEQSDLINHA